MASLGSFTLLATFLIARIEMPPSARPLQPPSWRDLFAFHGDRAFVRFLTATVAFYILQAQIYQILASRSGKPLRQIIRDTKRVDFYLDAAKAKEYGLIDEILEG